MVKIARDMKELPQEELQRIVDSFNNETNLRQSLRLMCNHLESYPLTSKFNDNGGWKE
jgi:phosphopantothenate synthetase